MLISKSKETIEAEVIIHKLQYAPEGKGGELSFRKSGFLIHDRVSTRFVICTVLDNNNGIAVEYNATNSPMNNEYINCVMNKYPNGSSTMVADHIYKWFNVDDGELFIVNKTHEVAGYVAGRRAGELKRYAMRRHS